MSIAFRHQSVQNILGNSICGRRSCHASVLLELNVAESRIQYWVIICCSNWRPTFIAHSLHDTPKLYCLPTISSSQGKLHANFVSLKESGVYSWSASFSAGEGSLIVLLNSWTNSGSNDGWVISVINFDCYVTFFVLCDDVIPTDTVWQLSCEGLLHPSLVFLY